MCRPNSKGANIHCIGAISMSGIEHIQIRRGSFRWETANEFILSLCTALSDKGIQMNSVVIDNAPCHSSLETEVLQHPGLILLRLAPYSPMLNPIEKSKWIQAALHAYKGPPWHEALPRLNYWSSQRTPYHMGKEIKHINWQESLLNRQRVWRRIPSETMLL